ncbi:Methylated-DNA--protein-cysteine methyltransferase [Sulfidibacter corallicola]|uniref:Methylated-DNA--protein-cysteine methyltransferase n=1 Tax=Sulfidibacter corallicola TaxID=2818388 RepID=A0A8A4TFG1_SULCO|nr:methylated-DNA--[protein]-cysteine S-methyltransferase [Sulfidibacter corallicola]QTD48829.1 methylated-DNA--[protein]-cysteine S-methyltransferase [Sulfidibacter corallicola]
MMHREFLASPVGVITIEASELGVTRISLGKPPTDAPMPSDITGMGRQQLEAYFAGERTRFDLPLDLHGTTFQRKVWSCLCAIPFGEVRSYGDIAAMIDNPKAVRAVGAANGRNPVAIVVPCHRVIGGDGTLTGFAAGIERKSWLLAHEGVAVKPVRRRRVFDAADLGQGNLFGD